jgi:hypothetical protein
MTIQDGTIGHALVKIGDSIFLVSGASGGGWKSTPSAIYLCVKDTDATHKFAIFIL